MVTILNIIILVTYVKFQLNLAVAIHTTKSIKKMEGIKYFDLILFASEEKQREAEKNAKFTGVVFIICILLNIINFFI